MKIVLASSSKQRQDILKMIGLKYDVITSLKEEQSNEKKPHKYVMELSNDKAVTVASNLKEKAIVIAADTIIYCNKKIYEKPKNINEVKNNLRELSNKTNFAYTGITIIDLYNNKKVSFYDKTIIKLRKIEEKEIEWYANNEEKIFKCCCYVPLGKAAVFIEKINGDYNNLFGLSPNKIFNKLIELGYNINDFEFDNNKLEN